MDNWWRSAVLRWRPCSFGTAGNGGASVLRSSCTSHSSNSFCSRDSSEFNCIQSQVKSIMWCIANPFFYLSKSSQKISWVKRLQKPLTSEFKKGYKWWSSVELFRRLILVLVAVSSPGFMVSWYLFFVHNHAIMFYLPSVILATCPILAVYHDNHFCIRATI